MLIPRIDPRAARYAVQDCKIFESDNDSVHREVPKYDKINNAGQQHDVKALNRHANFNIMSSLVRGDNRIRGSGVRL